jgi:hypothetical protein
MPAARPPGREESAVDHTREFREQGFTVLKGFFSKQQAAQLLSEIERCAELDADRPASLSGGGIRYTGAIYLRSELTRELLSDQRVIDLLTPIAGGDLWVTMDQAVTKYPGAGVFRWHQDNGYNRLKREHFQFWIACTPTRKQNGALMLAPRSHKRGLLPHSLADIGQMEVESEIGDTITIDADAGDVILFSSLALHCTGPNEADSERVAYVAEYMRMCDYAPNSNPPFFVAARDGVSNPHFTDKKPGARSLRNQLLYLGPRLSEAVKKPLRTVRDSLRSK